MDLQGRNTSKRCLQSFLSNSCGSNKVVNKLDDKFCRVLLAKVNIFKSTVSGGAVAQTVENPSKFPFWCTWVQITEIGIERALLTSVPCLLLAHQVQQLRRERGDPLKQLFELLLSTKTCAFCTAFCTGSSFFITLENNLC